MTLITSWRAFAGREILIGKLSMPCLGLDFHDGKPLNMSICVFVFSTLLHFLGGFPTKTVDPSGGLPLCPFS